MTAAWLLTVLFYHCREQPAPLQDLGSLMEQQYEDYLNGLIADSVVLSMSDLHQCVHSIEPPPDLSTTDKSVAGWLAGLLARSVG